MVTLIKYGALSGGVKYNINQMWICGLSTDSKPTTTIDGMPIPNGSVYTEVDTGKNFMFSLSNTTWYEVSIGGGGGAIGGIVLVGVTTTDLTDGATTQSLLTDNRIRRNQTMLLYMATRNFSLTELIGTNLVI